MANREQGDLGRIVCRIFEEQQWLLFFTAKNALAAKFALKYPLIAMLQSLVRPVKTAFVLLVGYWHKNCNN